MKKANNDDPSTWFERNITWLFTILGLGTVAGSFGAYFYVHGHSWTFERNTETWARLGDYIGGVANPLIALLALIGLLVTIRMQQREFHDVKESMEEQVIIAKGQARAQSLLSLMQTIMKKIEAIESQTISITEELYLGHDPEGDVFEEREIGNFVLYDEYQRYLSSVDDYLTMGRQFGVEDYGVKQAAGRLHRTIATGEDVLNQFTDLVDNTSADPIFAFYDGEIANRRDFLRVAFPDIDKPKQPMTYGAKRNKKESTE